MKCCKNPDFETIKKYDPKPKNPDGSIRWFLYRWDDGKDGYRKIEKCKNCGAYFLVQCYKLNKFADSSGKFYEDWYRVENEIEADKLNMKYTGIQLELKYKIHFERITAMKKYEYVHVHIGNFCGAKSEEHRSIIDEYASKGFRYAGFIPTKISDYGTIKDMDLVFETEC